MAAGRCAVSTAVVGSALGAAITIIAVHPAALAPQPRIGEQHDVS